MNILDPCFDGVWTAIMFECVFHVRNPKLLARFDPEDLYQEVRIAASRARPVWAEGPARLYAYLLAVTRREYIDLYRRHVEAGGRTINAEVALRGYDDDSRGVAASLAAFGRTPGSELLAAERIDAVRAAVGRLPEPERTVLILTHFRGLTLRQIGEMIGLATSTVKNRLDGAMERLTADAILAPFGGSR